MNHVAIDIGASGGTVFLGEVTESSFAVQEVHRFDNRPVEQNGRYVWDVDALVEHLGDGLRAADDYADGLDTVGIDTWGLDFGLLSDGELLRDPVSYRDPDSAATREKVFDAVGKRRLFEATGITNWNTPNTLWQLHTLAEHDSELLEQSDELLMMPQLLAAQVGGQPAGEATVASTTQMVDPERRTWATDLLDELSVPTDLLPTVSEPDQRLGLVDSETVPGLTELPEIVTTASHDTAAAVAGLPLSDDAAFLNTGSWFILGVERADPVRTDAAFEQAVSNELGVDGTVRLLKNINGFFLLEECRNAWREAGESVAYDALLSAANEAPPQATLVDTDADTFSIDEPMPDQIRAYCRQTDQPIPTGRGGIVRCLLDSLAAKTALHLDGLATVVDKPLKRIVLGGGGVRNELFCQLLADAIDRPVSTGPVEATAVGNVLTQAVAAGAVPNIEGGRELVESAFETTTYEPRAAEEWDDTKERLAALVEA